MAQPPKWWFCRLRSSQRSAYHHEDAGPSGGWTLSGCCSQKECGHLPTACQQRSTFAGLEEYLLCPGSLPWHSQCCQMAQPPKWWFCRLRSSQRSAYHHEDAGPSGGWTLSGCCSQKECGHLPTAYQQRSASAGLEGYLLCPGSLPWHSQCYQRAPPPKWWFYRSRFSQRFAWWS